LRTVQFKQVNQLLMPATSKPGPVIVSALKARSSFGRLLARVDAERRSVIIEKRGTPRAILLSIQDYVRLAAPEPEILRVIGEQAGRSGASKLTPGQIDGIIRTTRAARRRKSQRA
jgi:prevent-host-death family protein